VLFARGISPRPKMVTNSFGKRNFMQPMGRPQACTQGALFLFPLKVMGGGGNSISQRRTTFAKAYGIKVRCYGEHVGEHIGNLIRTHWELEGNIVRTH